MNKIIQYINKREELLIKAIRKAKQDKDKFPEGRLRTSPLGSYTRFYIVTENSDTTGKYITKENKQIIIALAQKDYNRRFLKKAEKELKILKQIISKLSKDNADLAYLNLSPERKNLITPYIQTDEMYAEEWQKKNYKSNPFMTEEKKYETKKGDKVRSKSEAILADIFYELGIPYRYEEQIRLKNGKNKYPDFTLLNIKRREEIYLEHMGLLDDEEYRKSNFKKLDEYRENGIYLGKNLLITYESEESPLDIKGIRKMIKELLI
ncbi:hypothetical protein QYZ88_016690 [Lachnospiraceae bacterium C1.1]|nr:hypothetical protein [Lachnospiraceae bacterium C1.1]